MFRWRCANIVLTCICVFTGRICGRDSFGSRLWGPNGSDRWHSSQALPTNQVALHWASLDHRPLPLTKLAPIHSVYVDGPLLLHILPRSLASSLHPDPGRSADYDRKEHNHTTICGLNTHIIPLFSLTFHKNANSPFERLCYCLFIDASNWILIWFWNDNNNWMTVCFYTSVLYWLLQFSSRKL